MRFLKISTSVDLPIGPFIDNTDGFTALTALTLTQPDIRLKKNGGAWAQKAAAQTLSHEENGYYEVTLDATDTDTLGCMRLAVNETGALPVWEEFMVVPANVWDSLFGADQLLVEVAALSTAAKAEVNAEVLDVLTVDTRGQPAQGAPAATQSIAGKIDDLHKFGINKLVSDANQIEVYNSAGTVVDHKSLHSKTATAYTRPAFISGP